MLSIYGERHQILHDSQEGFRAERCISKQLKLLIAELENAQFTNQEIYLLYIDLKCFWINQSACLLAIMKDLGYPKDGINLVQNIYSYSNTIFSSEHFGQTQKYQYKEEQSKETLSAHIYSLYF